MIYILLMAFTVSVFEYTLAKTYLKAFITKHKLDARNTSVPLDNFSVYRAWAAITFFVFPVVIVVRIIPQLEEKVYAWLDTFLLENVFYK